MSETVLPAQTQPVHKKTLSLDTIRRAANKIKREVGALGPLRKAAERKHQQEMDAYASSLPTISASEKQIVETLNSAGVLVVPVADLGIDTTAEMFASAMKLVPELRARPKDDRGNASRLPNARLAEERTIWLWGMQPKLLSLVENYIGLPVWYHGADIRQEVADGKTNDVRQWHLDAEDKRMFKIITYLNDVPSIDGGPFEYIDRNDTVKAVDRLHYVSGFVSDDKMDSIVPRQQWKAATGPAMIGAVCDTCRIFHRARAPKREDRFSITFSYTSRKPAKTYGTLGFTKEQMQSLSKDLNAHQRECLPGL